MGAAAFLRRRMCVSKLNLALRDGRLEVSNLRLNASNAFLNRTADLKLFVPNRFTDCFFNFANNLVGPAFDLVFVDTHD